MWSAAHKRQLNKGDWERSLLTVKHHTLILALSVLIADPACPPQHTMSPQSVIDLSKLGYPQPPCDYMFQDKDAYAKRHIEFLDSQRLMVSFPVSSQPCDKGNSPLPQRFRSVILATSGETLNSFEWNLGENVQAGPDGDILLSTGKEIHILDPAFTVVQVIPWVRDDDSAWKLTRHWTGSVVVAPSRHGFLVQDGYPQYRVAYFEGNPAKQVLAADSCPGGVAVADGGFACGQILAGSRRIAIRVGSNEWHVDDPLLQHAGLLVLATPETLLVLADKFQLYQVTSASENEKVADLHWLAPGWNSGFRYELASAAARRILFFSHGARFPISDTNGFGKYLRVAVVDLTSKKIIFRRQYAIDTDVAVSPDGHLLAVREKDGVALNALP